MEDSNVCSNLMWPAIGRATWTSIFTATVIRRCARSCPDWLQNYRFRYFVYETATVIIPTKECNKHSKMIDRDEQSAMLRSANDTIRNYEHSYLLHAQITSANVLFSPMSVLFSLIYRVSYCCVCYCTSFTNIWSVICCSNKEISSHVSVISACYLLILVYLLWYCTGKHLTSSDSLIGI